jgi:hypothetical protein
MLNDEIKNIYIYKNILKILIKIMMIKIKIQDEFYI